MPQAKPYALSIVGFDPSAGAGLLADIKTFEANGVYGFGVVSALTWQNDVAFKQVEWIGIDKIISQMEVLLSRFNIRFIKIGLLGHFEVLKNIIHFLMEKIKDPVIIYDPILKASAGFVFHETVQELFTDAIRGIYCITPNIPKQRNFLAQKTLMKNWKG